VALATGKPVWNVDAMRQFEVDKGYFGAAGSPLVEGGNVIANVGGKKGGIVAFEAKTGKVVWTATTDAASYSSGVAATILGRRYVVFLTRAGLVGLDPASGQVRFQRPWRARQAASVNAATPLIAGDRIFVSAEYGPGAGLLRFDGTKLSDVWLSDEALSNHYATSVLHDGVLYGFHGRQEFGPLFRAVDLPTGKVLWSTERFGAGSVTLAGNRLVIMRESGALMIAAASPKSFQQIASAQVLSATVRAYPAIADGVVYVRNDDTLVAVDLR
jgi:outer membrane protein assembly factor BamB